MSKSLTSFTAVSTFSECPFKYYLAYVAGEKPLFKPAYDFGKTLHDVIKNYYSLLPSAVTPKEVRMYLTQAAKKAGIDPSSRIVYLENFARFEEQRLSWNVNPKPIAVEKEFVREPLHGIVDVLFVDARGEKVVVDWKTSLKSDSQMWEARKLQGNIYMYLTGARRAIFYGLRDGNFEEFTYDEGFLKEKLERFFEGLKKEVYERRRGEHCLTCEYNIQCSAREWGFEVLEL
jgi:hypothetical protein